MVYRDTRELYNIADHIIRYPLEYVQPALLNIVLEASIAGHCLAQRQPHAAPETTHPEHPFFSPCASIAAFS